MSALAARQVLDEFARRVDLGIDNAYSLAMCLRELSRPERYRDELGFKSFEQLLAAHAFLPSRMTAHKWFTVIGNFSQDEVKRLGGFEKSYLLVRASLRVDPKANPRDMVSGRKFPFKIDPRKVSTRGVNSLLRGIGKGRRKPDTKGARRAAGMLRTRFRRARVEAAVRVHLHDGKPCVAAHFAERSAGTLVSYMKAAQRAGVATT
jgi:hypothetical protein